jgi:hypothetical protein
MDLRVIGKPARGYRSLGADGAAAANRPRECDGAMAGHRAPWITDFGGGEAGSQRRNPAVAELWSVVTVEHDFAALWWRGFWRME